MNISPIAKIIECRDKIASEQTKNYFKLYRISKLWRMDDVAII